MHRTNVPEVGSYAKKQLFGASRLLAWSHQARFRFAINLVKKMKPRRIVDYGCGDGTFLYLLGGKGTHRIGIDYDEQQILDCQKRYSGEIEFVTTNKFSWAPQADVISCMEVIEHCTVQQRQEVLQNIRKLMDRDARLILSVPVEIGPTLIAKHLVRWFLALTNFPGYGYREKYTPVEFLKMVLATKNTKFTRPLYSTKEANGETRSWHGHKGFNWRSFRSELENDFVIESIYFTPIDFFYGLFASQVWFICRQK
jgi:2-polyprenyl-3-methyl-5-hydroxy-6-metoxy-1,4-benzoquinol methylase